MRHLAPLATMALLAIGVGCAPVTQVTTQPATEPTHRTCIAARAILTHRAECRQVGWVVTRHLVIAPDGIVNYLWHPTRTDWTILFETLPPCPEEDSHNCAWDAGHSGNGVGTSFVDVHGSAYYADGTSPEDWQPIPAGAQREFAGHGACQMNVGPTTSVVCADGYRTTS